jgi:hypothetical protein
MEHCLNGADGFAVVKSEFPDARGHDVMKSREPEPLP